MAAATSGCWRRYACSSNSASKAYSMGTAALSGLGSACRRRFRLVCRSFAGSLAGAMSLLYDLIQWAGMRCSTHGACALGRVSHLWIAGFRLCCQGEMGIRKPALRKADDFEMLLRRAELFAFDCQPHIWVLLQIPRRIDLDPVRHSVFEVSVARIVGRGARHDVIINRKLHVRVPFEVPVLVYLILASIGCMQKIRKCLSTSSDPSFVCSMILAFSREA